jgi:hypothetical protein
MNKFLSTFKSKILRIINVILISKGGKMSLGLFGLRHTWGTTALTQQTAGRNCILEA